MLTQEATDKTVVNPSPGEADIHLTEVSHRSIRKNIKQGSDDAHSVVETLAGTDRNLLQESKAKAGKWILMMVIKLQLQTRSHFQGALSRP